MARQSQHWPLRIILALAVVSAIAVWVHSRNRKDPDAPATRLSDLAEPPDWPQLDHYQKSITRKQFTDLLESVFTMSDRWKEFIEVDDGSAAIDTGDGDPFELRFASSAESANAPDRWWHPAAELPPAPPDQPLDALHVAIDPGHLGGPWARMEERWFQVGKTNPVTEGDLTLKVARMLKPRLEKLGAKVTLLRSDTAPITDWRPDSLLAKGHAKPSTGSDESPRHLAERLFYRSAEIRARARKVNQEIHPDLVLCLHFNAEEWGNPAKPTLIDRNHVHFLINGAFTDGEVALADQRFEMLTRLLQGIHTEEAAIALAAAKAFAARTGLPPYRYKPDSTRALMIADNPYVWARNLLANRIYRCPVVFYEPYVMNSTEAHARIQAGDYDGTRKIAGKPHPSIFREYADAVADGLADYYARTRTGHP